MAQAVNAERRHDLHSICDADLAHLTGDSLILQQDGSEVLCRQRLLQISS